MSFGECIASISISKLILPDGLSQFVRLSQNSICPDLPDVPNAQVQNRSVSYQKGDIVSFTCDVGYISENPVGFVCSSNGWIRVYMGVCQLKPCLPPANITNGDYQIISGNGFVYGTTIKYSCNNGGWSDDAPQCEKQSMSEPQAGGVGICPELPDVPNAQVQNREVFYQRGDIVNFTCDVGYISENPVGFVCSSNGWIRVYMGICQLKPCLPLANITNGNYQIISGNGFVYGTTIKYSCNNGFQIKSGNGTLTCLLSGWSDDVPQCEKQQSISDPHGDFHQRCHDKWGSPSCLCPPGYELTADGTACQESTCFTCTRLSSVLSLRFPPPTAPAPPAKALTKPSTTSWRLSPSAVQRQHTAPDRRPSGSAGWRVLAVPWVMSYQLIEPSVKANVDECSSYGRFCEYKCENTVGSFTCTCPPGYYKDGWRCKDYDECKSGFHTCTPQQTCINYKGGYTCLNTIQCEPPYVKASDRMCMCSTDNRACRNKHHTTENHYVTISSGLSTPADIYRLEPGHSHGDSNLFKIKSGNEQQEFSIRQINDRSAMLVLTRPIRGRNIVVLEVEVEPVIDLRMDRLMVTTDHNLSALLRLLIHVS
ncbi:hypothetical protein WMY93_003238 [Mugilogobius chulae]|uniref:Uncharacterized protein n=1 Tax=Mugilogobius chulae TaxID=88201 RepID=A0AAW0Q6S1_9GOBI